MPSAEQIVEMAHEGRLAPVLIIAFSGWLVVEWLICLCTGRRWTHGEALPNAFSTMVGMTINIGAVVVFTNVYEYMYREHRIFTIQNTLVGIFFVYLIMEFHHYVHHWLGHRTGLFWAIHSVHHSAEEMNVLVASRLMWGVLLTLPLAMLVLPVVGVSIAQFILINLVMTVYGIFTHTNVIPKLGFLEHFLVTPANHRVHHGRQPKYLDRNYGQITVIFDKLFGSHQVEEEAPDYGLVNPTHERNPFMFQSAGIRTLAAKIRSAPRWTDKLAYLWRPPGWSHVRFADPAMAGSSRAQADPKA